MFTNSSKDIWLNKKVENPPRSEKYFPSLMAFVDCTGQQIARPADKNRKKMYYSSNKKRHTVKNQFVANNSGFIIHKAGHKKWSRHGYDVYKKNHPATPKKVVNVYDLGYLGVEKDFPDKNHLYPSERRETTICHKKKNRITNFTLERE
jgi:hypothetical protein